MLSKSLFAAVILVSLPAVSFAGSPGTAQGDPDRSFTLHGAQSGKLSEAQIRKDLAARGFTNITLDEEIGLGSTTGAAMSASAPAGDRLWTGSADKGDRHYDIRVDGTGRVTDVTR